MATQDLITRLMDAAETMPAADAVDLVHELLDDSTIEADAAPVGVGEAARLVGLTPHTLRFYEAEGLVAPARNGSGYREYSAFDLRRLVFLTRMRVSGMTMDELKRYIALVDRGEVTMGERREIMLAQHARIARRIRELELALETTEYKIGVYTPEGE